MYDDVCFAVSEKLAIDCSCNVVISTPHCRRLSVYQIILEWDIFYLVTGTLITRPRVALLASSFRHNLLTASVELYITN